MISAQVLFLAIAAAVLLLHAIGLPANWILLGLALIYALVTGLDPIGWWTLLTLAAFAGVAEAFEFFVGVGYTAKRGATRWGVSGAFVGGSRALIEYLHNHARSYVYSTHLPPPQAAAILAAVRLVQEADDQREQLRERVRQFRDGVASLPFELLPSATAIQPLIVGDENRTLALAAQLREQGCWVGAIRPPTVPKGSARLRITLSAAHTRADVQRLIDALHSAL